MNVAKNIIAIALVTTAASVLAIAAPSNTFAAGACGTASKPIKAEGASKGGVAVTQEAPEKKGGKAEKS